VIVLRASGNPGEPPREGSLALCRGGLRVPSQALLGEELRGIAVGQALLQVLMVTRAVGGALRSSGSMLPP
jgi:hypothetical protein